MKRLVCFLPALVLASALTVPAKANPLLVEQVIAVVGRGLLAGASEVAGRHFAEKYFEGRSQREVPQYQPAAPSAPRDNVSEARRTYEVVKSTIDRCGNVVPEGFVITGCGERQIVSEARRIYGNSEKGTSCGRLPVGFECSDNRRRADVLFEKY